MPALPSQRTHATPQQQEDNHAQATSDAYFRLARSPDFGVFYAAMYAKIQAARTQLPTRIVTEDDKQLYNQLIGFIQGIETMFLAMKKYIDEPIA